jgi:hypothetical protein
LHYTLKKRPAIALIISVVSYFFCNFRVAEQIIEEGGDPQAEAEKIRKSREMGELDVDG